jgi:hypothetical protein
VFGAWCASLASCCAVAWWLGIGPVAAAPRKTFCLVQWVKHQNTNSPAPGVLVKNAAGDRWDAGAVGCGVLWGDGEVRFRFSRGAEILVGLSEAETGPDPASVEYAIVALEGGRFGVREGGRDAGARGTYEATDVFSIQRVGTRIRYAKNNEVFYRSHRRSEAPLGLGAALRRRNTKVAGCEQRGFTRWWEKGPRGELHMATPVDDLGLEHSVTDYTFQEPGSPVLHRNGSTFWAFVAKRDGTGQPNESIGAPDELQVVVMQRRGTGPPVSRVVRRGIALDVGHVGPSLGIDRAGYLHLVCNQHSAPSWQYYRSKHPVAAPGAQHDVTLGFDSLGDDPDRVLPHTRATYVRFVSDRTGRLYATYRFYTRDAPVWHNGIFAAALAVYDEKAAGRGAWSALGGTAYLPADPAPFLSELGTAYDDGSTGLVFRIADPTIPGPYGYRLDPRTRQRIAPWAYAGLPPLRPEERPRVLLYDIGGGSRFLKKAVPGITVRGKQVPFDAGEREAYDGKREASIPWNRSNIEWSIGAENRTAFHAYQAYKYDVKFDRNNRMHVVCQIKSVEYRKGKPVVQCTPDFSTHLLYASSDDGGVTFSRADGSAVTLPMTTLRGTTPGDRGLMTVENSGAVAMYASTKDHGTIEFSSFVAFLADGSPVVLYRVSAGAGQWETRVRRWSASRRRWEGQGENEHWHGVTDLGSGGWMNDHRGYLYSFAPNTSRKWLRTTTDDGRTWIRIAELQPGNSHQVDPFALARSGVFVYQETVLNLAGKTRAAKVRVLPLRHWK